MKIYFRTLANPYYIFAIIWAVALILYVLGWSDLFPPISAGLAIFLVVAITSQFLFGLAGNKINLFGYVSLSDSLISLKNYLFGLNLFAWLLNFAYSGVPLYKILRGQEFDYQQFGMPSVIVFAVSFNGFLCVYYLHAYLTQKNKRMLLYVALCMFYFVLAFSRGMLLMTGISMFFLWMSAQHKTIRLKFVLMLTVVVLLVMYVFGVAGNIRMSQLIYTTTGQSIDGYNSKTILKVGSASQKFTDNLVPNEFFWSYIYIASPLSNLQYNVSNEPPANYSAENVVGFGINEFMFDVISKRLNTVLHTEHKKPLLIVEQLTVCTIFAESYRYLGWVGTMAMLVFLLFVPIFYMYILGFNSELVPVGAAILMSIYFFSFFDNMFVISALGLQLVYPWLLRLLAARYNRSTKQVIA